MLKISVPTISWKKEKALENQGLHRDFCSAFFLADYESAALPTELYQHLKICKTLALQDFFNSVPLIFWKVGLLICFLIIPNQW